MADRVLAGVASLPEREASLQQVVRSLAPQVDLLAVSLNGYEQVPGWLAAYDNVAPVLLGEPNGGDAEKFSAVDDWVGYALTCDDDVGYPPDYVEQLVAGIERYGRRRACSYHGGTTAGYDHRRHGAATGKRLRCLGALAADDLEVNVVGTGTLGWHTEHVPVWRALFRHPNMADVHMACHAHEQGIPLAVLAHPEGWLRDICPPGGRRIYEANAAADGSPQDTRALRQAELGRYAWAWPPAKPPAKPWVRVSIATCRRPQLLQGVLDDLAREAAWCDLEVAVYEDPSGADYRRQRAYCAERGWHWHRMPYHYGKGGHWKLVSEQLSGCEASPAEWFVFMPDDVRMVRYAIPRAIHTWHLLERPTALTLWRLKDHEGQMNWTGHRPVERPHGWEVYHVDGLYLCKRELPEALGYRLTKPTKVTAATSSGVGRQMSITLHRQRRRMYRVSETLVWPVHGVPSVMNPGIGDRPYQWEHL